MDIAGFASWLWKTLNTLLVSGRNVCVELLNYLIEEFAEAAHALIDTLPNYTCPSPGQLIDSIGLLSALNWVLPISFFVDCLSMLVVAYTLHFVISPTLRVFKVMR